MNKRTTSRVRPTTRSEIDANSSSELVVDSGDAARSVLPFKLRGRVIRTDNFGRVCLNDMHKAGGFSVNQKPHDWTRLEVTSRFVEKVLQKTTGKSRNWAKSEILSVLCAKVGAGGGVWAHPIVALSYAKYLSSDLHYEVNEVFLRAQSGDAVLADEILEKASPEANAWAGARAMGRAERKGFTQTLQDHGVVTWGFGSCTNAIYRELYGTDANGLRIRKGATSSKPLRDKFNTKELAFTAAAEHLASERIAEEKRFGNIDCQTASALSAANMRKAIDADRASRRKVA